MSIKEKVAFIKGLVEGLELETDKKEVKVINAILELLDEMALSISVLEDSYDEVCDQLDAIDEDLNDLEDDYYGDTDEDDDDDEVTEKDIEEMESEQYYEVTCPSCGEQICLTEDVILSGEKMPCPSCGEALEFNFEDNSDDEEKASEEE